MGIYSDLLASASTLDIGQPIEGVDASVVKELMAIKDRHDPDAPTAYASGNEVQTLAATGASAGTFTLTFTLQSGETFTTAAIAYNANAATIEGAIDTAATTASVVGWTNGDISVANASTADLATTTFTYDGASVANQNHSELTVGAGSLTGGTITVATTAEGQPSRLGLGALAALGVIEGTPPAYRGTPTTNQFTRADLTAVENRPSTALIKALIEEASYEEQVDYAANLYPVLRLL